MSAFLTALTSIGSQYGEAKNEARQEKEARSDKLRQLDVQDAYLQLARQAETRQAAAQKEQIAKGDLIKIGNRLWSVSQGKYVDTQQPNPLDSLKEYISKAPQEEQPELARVGKMTAEADPGSPEKAVQAVLARHRELKAEADRREDKAAAEQARREDKAAATTESERYHTESRKDTQDFQRQMREEQHDFVKSMFDARREGLTPAAEKVLYSVEPVVSQLDRMREDIHNLGLDNNNQRGYLLGARINYAFGGASPEGMLAKDIAGLSLGSVIEAASAIQGTSRSLQALKLAAVHTPNAWKDSPELIRQKLEEIRRRLVDIMNDAKKYGTKSGIPVGETSPAGGAPANDDPLGLLK